MKHILKTIAALLIFAGCTPDTEKKSILKQTTDSRGLTSVIFADGKDTFAIDYLSPQEYAEFFK